MNVGQLFGAEHYEEAAIDIEHPLFVAVTHLELFDEFDIEDDEGPAWFIHLCNLPALTHLSFNSAAHPDALRRILASFPLLQVLLVTFPTTDDTSELFAEYVGELGVADTRLVIATYGDCYDDWEIGARGGDDIWVWAEEVIARQKQDFSDIFTASLIPLH